MSDEHNARMMGCAGHPLAKTPHLDSLAARGTRFLDAYTSSPICVPARASFATGRYIHDIEYWDNSIAYDGRVRSWGHRLQEAGVRVESIGKLHYRLETDPTGFDKQHIPMHIAGGVGMLQLSIRKQFPGFVPPPRKRWLIAEAASVGESDYTRYDRRIADTATQWLHDAAGLGKPWVLFVSFVTPHYPLVVPKEFFDLYPLERMPDPRYGPDSVYQPHPWLAELRSDGPPHPQDQRKALAAYLGLVSFMDAQVGRVLSALDSAGLRGSTRVLYTSDHGENAGKRGFWGKSNHYEEAVAVPMIVAGEGVPIGKLSGTPASLVDAYPTVLKAVGLPVRGEAIPGRSLFELANTDDDHARLVFSEYHAARSPSASYMVRKGRFKYIYYVGFDAELFDLEADPEESTNLATSARCAETVRNLEALLRSIVDPEDVDRRANEAQRLLIESRGGPEQVMANLPTEKLYTPVPAGLLS